MSILVNSIKDDQDPDHPANAAFRSICDADHSLRDRDLVSGTLKSSSDELPGTTAVVTEDRTELALQPAPDSTSNMVIH